MKKFIPVLLGMALTIGAVTMYAGPQDKSTAKTKGTGKSAPKKSKGTK